MQGSLKINHSPISPSFNSYSSEKLEEIAARVVQEIADDPRQTPDNDSDHPGIFSWIHDEDGHLRSLNADQNDAEEEQNDDVDDDDDDDFEFAVVWKEADFSPSSADEIFCNGQIRPIYPLFDAALLSSQEQELSIASVLTASKQTKTTTTPTKKSMRSPLGKLFGEDRGEASCSSSEADELDGVSPATYCVWAPGKVEEENRQSAAERRCKKSHSAGSSKRWKLRDLVFRSHSDGKETFVFLAPPSSQKSVRLLGGYTKKENNNNDNNKKAQEVKGSVVSVKEHIRYTKNNNNKDIGDKRQSFLPYRQELVGLFSNNVVNGINKNPMHPF